MPFDLGSFNQHYRNDLTGATDDAPAVRLKTALLAYSQGIISSHMVEEAFRHNVVFIALTGDAKRHFTTFAAFSTR